MMRRQSRRRGRAKGAEECLMLVRITVNTGIARLAYPRTPSVRLRLSQKPLLPVGFQLAEAAGGLEF